MGDPTFAMRDLKIHNALKKKDLILTELYHGFVSLALNAKIPIIIFTPTWRANYERLAEANISENVNRDAVRLLNGLREAWDKKEEHIYIAGSIGCRNDAYRPEKALSKEEARDFHQWQIDQLCPGSIDLMVAGPSPAVSEASGIALAAARIKKGKHTHEFF